MNQQEVSSHFSKLLVEAMKEYDKSFYHLLPHSGFEEDASVKTEPEARSSGEPQEPTGHPQKHSEGFSIFHMDFARVELPFIIGVWILSASIAKIGESSL